MKKAPEFTLPDQNGVIKQLSDYKGRWVVIYFYPKDDTPGCTTEACNFRDSRDLIAEYGNAEVIGISKDSVASHRKFADKHKLNFTLLSDSDGSVTEAYGAWGKRSLFGRNFNGILRNTYLIDASGKIVKVYEKVDPKEHAGEIISDLRAQQLKT